MTVVDVMWLWMARKGVVVSTRKVLYVYIPLAWLRIGERKIRWIDNNDSLTY